MLVATSIRTDRSDALMTATAPDIHNHAQSIVQRDDVGRAARRGISDEDWTRFEGYAREMLGAFGMDLATPGTEATPRRFIRALFDATMATTATPSYSPRS